MSAFFKKKSFSIDFDVNTLCPCATEPNGRVLCGMCQGDGCKECMDLGYFTHLGKACKTCRGEVRIKQQHKASVKLEPGFEEFGEPLYVQSDLGKRLEVHVTQEPHEVFTRKGPHLYMSLNISILDALTAFESEVVLPNKEVVRFQCVNVVTPSSVICVEGKGFPVWKDGKGRRGNLFIQPNIIFPTQTVSRAGLYDALEDVVDMDSAYEDVYEGKIIEK
jgi:DnaJ-class molecular chaperone